jgi:2,3-bisphosphoglycerate-independent phosphoglycerate mutase
LLRELMDLSEPILGDHPVNHSRTAGGQKPATQVWLWGQGKAPRLEPFERVYGKRGAIISAVDLVRGVGISASTSRGRPATSTPTTPPRAGPASPPWPTTTSSASTSRRPTRPHTRANRTRKSRRSSGSTPTSSARCSKRCRASATTASWCHPTTAPPCALAHMPTVPSPSWSRELESSPGDSPPTTKPLRRIATCHSRRGTN